MSTHAPDAIGAMREFFYKGFCSVPAARVVHHGDKPVKKTVLEDVAAETQEDGLDDVAKHDEDSETSQAIVQPLSELALTEQTSSMLFHLDVYQVADFIRSKHLKTLAEKNFACAARAEWANDQFSDAVQKVYDITSGHASGRALRDVAVEICAEHLRDLCVRSEQLVAMMSDVTSIGADLAMALIGVYPGLESSPIVHAMKVFFCGACKFLGRIKHGANFRNDRCPLCRKLNIQISDRIAEVPKTLSCKGEECTFILETSDWQNDNDDFMCPNCNWIGELSAWEKTMD